MSDVLTRQVGGDHYKTMPFQPVVFAMQAGYDACASYTLKHVCRHAKLERGGPLDLCKAAHYVELRSQLWGPWNYPRRAEYRGPSIEGFCNLNTIEGREREFLVKHHAWVHNWTSARAGDLVDDLQLLCADRYPLFSLD